MEFVLGVWSPTQVEEVQTSPHAALALDIQGEVVWRHGVEEVLSCRPVLPNAIKDLTNLVKVNSSTFKACFHVDSLEPLEGFSCPIVGVARWTHATVPDKSFEPDENVYVSDGLILEAFQVSSFFYQHLTFKSFRPFLRLSPKRTNGNLSPGTPT